MLQRARPLLGHGERDVREAAERERERRVRRSGGRLGAQVARAPSRVRDARDGDRGAARRAGWRAQGDAARPLPPRAHLGQGVDRAAVRVRPTQR